MRMHEAVRYLGGRFSATTIRSWCERGWIEGAWQPPGGNWDIPVEGLDAFAAKHDPRQRKLREKGRIMRLVAGLPEDAGPVPIPSARSDDDDVFLDTHGAVEFLRSKGLKASPHYVRRRADKGDIDGALRAPGGRWRFSLRGLEKYAASLMPIRRRKR